MSVRENQKVRTRAGIIIMLILAAVHGFRLGSYLNGNAYIFYYSYASDLMLPFGVYFLLCMNELKVRILRNWYVKAFICFGAMTFSELLQYFNIYFFGVTFDWLDILMYGIGTAAAVILDTQIFENSLPSWKYNRLDE